MPERTIGVGTDWELVDQGWGRAAVDFATLSEPANCREYVALHHGLGVSDGERLIDVACGSGLAIELAPSRRRLFGHRRLRQARSGRAGQEP